MLRKFLGSIFNESEYQKELAASQNLVQKNEREKNESDAKKNLEIRRSQQKEHEKQGELAPGECLSLLGVKDAKRYLTSGTFFEMSVHTSFGGKNSKYAHNEDSAFAAHLDIQDTHQEGMDKIFFGVVDGVGGSSKGRASSMILCDRMAHFFSRGEQEIFAKENVEKITLAGGNLPYERVNVQALSMEEALHKGFEVADDASWKRVFLNGCACTVVCGVEREKREVTIANIGDTRGIVLVETVSGDVFVALKTQIQNQAGMSLKDSRSANEEYFFEDSDKKRTLIRRIGNTLGYMDDPTKDVQSYRAKPGEKVTVILGSDGGLGDRVSDYEVLESYRKNHGDVQKIEADLFDLAMNRNGAYEFVVSFGSKAQGPSLFYDNQGASDNVTISVGQFKFL